MHTYIYSIHTHNMNIIVVYAYISMYIFISHTINLIKGLNEKTTITTIFFFYKLTLFSRLTFFIRDIPDQVNISTSSAMAHQQWHSQNSKLCYCCCCCGGFSYNSCQCTLFNISYSIRLSRAALPAVHVISLLQGFLKITNINL